MPKYVFNGPVNDQDYTEILIYNDSNGAVKQASIGETVDVTEATASQLKARFKLESAGGTPPVAVNDKTENNK